MGRKLVEGVDYRLYYVKFPNRANPALSVLCDDGTADIYLNTRYDEERLREELAHELRHLQSQHFFVDIPVERAERQADGEPVVPFDAVTARGEIVHFQSLAAFAHWARVLLAQREIAPDDARLQFKPTIPRRGKKRSGGV